MIRYKKPRQVGEAIKLEKLSFALMQVKHPLYHFCDRCGSGYVNDTIIAGAIRCPKCAGMYVMVCFDGLDNILAAIREWRAS